MSILRSMFGPSKREIWQQLSTQIGAEFVDGGFWGGDKVRAHVKDWTVTLDTYTVSTGKSSVTFTRMRAPFVNADGFRFSIYRKGVFTGVAKMLGMQDIEIGHPEFDDAFVIKGNDEGKLRDLFADDRVRELIATQRNINFEVRDDEKWFGNEFPEGVDELYFQVVGIIKDVDRLENLYNLFSAVLNRLCHIGSAYENDPHVTL